MSNARLIPAAPAILTPGEAVAGMILHGLGCAPRPLSLPPQCFARRPRELVVREGGDAERCKRVKLGRTREEAYAYGGDLLCQELALAVWAHEGIDLRCKHLDTTRFARSGAYRPERDEPAMTITDGDAKDPRPHLTQAVLALIVSHEGGGPFVRTRWEGTTADIPVVQERPQGVMTAWHDAPSPRSWSADAPRSHEATAPNLHGLGFMTRIAHTLGGVSQGITQARTGEGWHGREETTRDQGVELGHDGRAPRWRVVFSQAALARAEATVTPARQRADATIEQPRFPRQAQGFSTPEAAQQARATWAKAWKDHELEASRLLEHKRDAGQGRPTPHTPLTASEGHIDRHVQPHEEAMRPRLEVNAGCVRGTKISARAVRDPEISAASTGQARGEGGLRWLNDPLGVVSSWLVQTPCRIEA